MPRIVYILFVVFFDVQAMFSLFMTTRELHEFRGETSLQNLRKRLQIRLLGPIRGTYSLFHPHAQEFGTNVLDSIFRQEEHTYYI